MRALFWISAAAICACSSESLVAADDFDPDDADVSEHEATIDGDGADDEIGFGDGAWNAPTWSKIGFDPGEEPTTVIQPKYGELTVIQLRIPLGRAQIGESAIIVGPDGTMVLLDVANTSHADDVLEAVENLNSRVLTPANGFPQRTLRQVEWIVLTHHHKDHIGALSALLAGSKPLTVKHGVIHRGYTDLGKAVTEPTFNTMCTALRSGTVDRPLCTAAKVAPCDADRWSENYPAIECSGLEKGDLTAAPTHEPSYIPLGMGARLQLTGANGYYNSGTALVPPVANWGVTENDAENARSVTGVLSYGGFRYHLGGDLTGAGGFPDMESRLVSVAGSFYGTLGVDVVHVHHHARKTGSGPNFVNVAAPNDGRVRNVLAGINAAYVGSPQQPVLDAWTDSNRLAGGRFWVTDVAPRGKKCSEMVNAKAPITLQTIQSGVGYRIQASRATPYSMAFPSLR